MFKIKEYHLKYIFYKYKQIFFHETIVEIYEYSKYIDDLGH